MTSAPRPMARSAAAPASANAASATRRPRDDDGADGWRYAARWISSTVRARDGRLPSGRIAQPAESPMRGEACRHTVCNAVNGAAHVDVCRSACPRRPRIGSRHGGIDKGDSHDRSYVLLHRLRRHAAASRRRLAFAPAASASNVAWSVSIGVPGFACRLRATTDTGAAIGARAGVWTIRTTRPCVSPRPPRWFIRRPVVRLRAYVAPAFTSRCVRRATTRSARVDRATTATAR